MKVAACLGNVRLFCVGPQCIPSRKGCPQDVLMGFRPSVSSNKLSAVQALDWLIFVTGRI